MVYLQQKGARSDVDRVAAAKAPRISLPPPSLSRSRSFVLSFSLVYTPSFTILMRYFFSFLHSFSSLSFSFRLVYSFLHFTHELCPSYWIVILIVSHTAATLHFKYFIYFYFLLHQIIINIKWSFTETLGATYLCN